MPGRPPCRRGTLLIIVAGISALLAATSLSFLLRMRSDGEEMVIVERETQAHIMLMAGLNYIQENARLGYDADGGFSQDKHVEAAGWIDVRNGQLGPLDNVNPNAPAPLFSWTSHDSENVPTYRAWPAPRSKARCPMYVMRRPHFAVQLTIAYNPIVSAPAAPDFSKPFLRNKDPLPVAPSPGSTFSLQDGISDSFRGWDPTPRQDSIGRSWFRVYREDVDQGQAASGPAMGQWATFVITCGAGGTQGFRDWNEVVVAQAAASFSYDPQLFQSLLDAESRLWYRVEWSPYVAPNDCHNAHPYNEGQPAGFDSYLSFSPNASDCWNANGGHESWATTPHVVNPVGTFRYIQALRFAPTNW